MSFGAFRDWTRDDPVRDADLFAIDSRPVIGKCLRCGNEICGPKGGYGGDRRYEFLEGMVCFSCYPEWSTSHSIDSDGTDVYCSECGENQNGYVYYEYDGEVFCMTCFGEWAEEFRVEV